MRSNQKGLAVGQVLVVMAVFGLIGAIGYYVFNQSNKNTTDINPSQSNEKVAETETQNTSRYITVVPDSEVVRLFKPGDEEKLPETIPASFKDYMKAELAKNTKPDENGCYSGYSVNTFSPLNVSGATGAVNGEYESDDVCIGGAKVFWYEKNQQWDMLGLQGNVTCKELGQTTIYEEFIPQCLVSETGDEMRPNPNGSINDAMAREN